MRRVQYFAATTARATVGAAALAAPNRTPIIEPLSIWWSSSWTAHIAASMIFWFPTLIAEWFYPAFTHGKIPHTHYILERRAELKLRSQLDEIYTVWNNELDQGSLDDAISRTF